MPRKKNIINKTNIDNENDNNVVNEFSQNNSNIQQTEKSSIKHNIKEWLTDNKNTFDRITQTQSNYNLNKDIECSLDMSSISQRNKNDNFMQYKKCRPRANSLNIYIKKFKRTPKKRHSISCEKIECENYNIDDSEKIDDDGFNFIHKKEDDFLDSINNVHSNNCNNKIKESQILSGWERMEKFNKSLLNEKRSPTKLNIEKHNSFELQLFEQFAEKQLENNEKIKFHVLSRNSLNRDNESIFLTPNTSDINKKQKKESPKTQKIKQSICSDLEKLSNSLKFYLNIKENDIILENFINDLNNKISDLKHLILDKSSKNIVCEASSQTELTNEIIKGLNTLSKCMLPIETDKTQQNEEEHNSEISELTNESLENLDKSKESFLHKLHETKEQYKFKILESIQKNYQLLIPIVRDILVVSYYKTQQLKKNIEIEEIKLKQSALSGEEYENVILLYNNFLSISTKKTNLTSKAKYIEKFIDIKQESNIETTELPDKDLQNLNKPENSSQCSDIFIESDETPEVEDNIQTEQESNIVATQLNEENLQNSSDKHEKNFQCSDFIEINENIKNEQCKFDTSESNDIKYLIVEKVVKILLSVLIEISEIQKIGKNVNKELKRKFKTLHLEYEDLYCLSKLIMNLIYIQSLEDFDINKLIFNSQNLNKSNETPLTINNNLNSTIKEESVLCQNNSEIKNQLQQSNCTPSCSKRIRGDSDNDDNETVCSKRPCNKFMNNDLTIKFETEEIPEFTDAFADLVATQNDNTIMKKEDTDSNIQLVENDKEMEQIENKSTINILQIEKSLKSENERVPLQENTIFENQTAVNILQNITLTKVTDIDSPSDSSEEADIIESSPEKETENSLNKKLSLEENIFPPPIEFRDECVGKPNLGRRESLFLKVDNPFIKKPVVTFSRLPKNHLSLIVDLAKKGIINYSETFTSEVTHLIVSVNPNNYVLNHTMKYLKSVAYGLWILNIDWIKTCSEKNYVVQEEQFEVIDKEGKLGPQRSRLYHNTDPLFRGFKFNLVPPFHNTNVSELEDIIIKLGGVCINNRKELLNKNGFYCFIITEIHKSSYESYEAWLYQYKTIVVDVNWILFSVAEYKLLKLKPYVLFGISYLKKAGLPIEMYEDEEEEEEEEED